MNNQLLAVSVLILATAGFASPNGQAQGMKCCADKTSAQVSGGQSATQAKAQKGVQKATVTIDGGKYSPSVITVKKGLPVELTFVGGKRIGCGGTIVFKSLKITKEVESGKSVVVQFTPKTAGTINFTCGMGMFDGKVIVK